MCLRLELIDGVKRERKNVTDGQNENFTRAPLRSTAKFCGYYILHAVILSMGT